MTLNTATRSPQRLVEWDAVDTVFLDMDGTLVETTGGCKAGMDIAYDGTWGYHPLVVSLAETGEVLLEANEELTPRVVTMAQAEPSLTPQQS